MSPATMLHSLGPDDLERLIERAVRRVLGKDDDMHTLTAADMAKRHRVSVATIARWEQQAGKMPPRNADGRWTLGAVRRWERDRT